MTGLLFCDRGDGGAGPLGGGEQGEGLRRGAGGPVVIGDAMPAPVVGEHAEDQAVDEVRDRRLGDGRERRRHALGERLPGLSWPQTFGLVEPEPPPGVLPVVVLSPHPQDRAHPREAVEHHREERPVSEAGERARVDVIEELPRLGRGQDWRRALGDDVLRPPHRCRGVHREDLADDEPARCRGG